MTSARGATKRRLGQFYTRNLSFLHPAIDKWIASILDYAASTCSDGASLLVCEPFAGENSLLTLWEEGRPGALPAGYRWASYDIDPPSVNLYPQVPVLQRDTIKAPVPADVVITNPPYISKNSAKRAGLVGIDFGPYDDLYLMALDATLLASKYVLAIIPASFLTRGKLRSRLVGFISIPHQVFDDTTFPVGIALFTPLETKADCYQLEGDDFYCYQGDRPLGTYANLLARAEEVLGFDEGAKKLDVQMRFNDPYGDIGILALDSRLGKRVQFVPGEAIDSAKVKHSSRSYTRVGLQVGGQALSQDERALVIEQANKVLEDYRASTADVFLTSYRDTVKASGHYRRRLDWGTAKAILLKALYLADT